MMQVIADNGFVEENDSNSFFPLVDSLRFEVKSVLLILSVIIVALAGQEINCFSLLLSKFIGSKMQSVSHFCREIYQYCSSLLLWS